MKEETASRTFLKFAKNNKLFCKTKKDLRRYVLFKLDWYFKVYKPIFKNSNNLINMWP